MATAKKAPAKKTAAAKAAPRKAPVKKVAPVKRTAPKKTTTKKTAAKKSAAVEYETFKLAKNTPPLMSFKITRQTVYWVFLMAFVIFFQLWIIKIQLEVAQVLQAQQTYIESQE